MKLKAKYIGYGFVVLSFSYTVYAEMLIRLNKDHIFTSPIEAKEVAAIEFKQKQALNVADKSSRQSPDAVQKMTYQVGPSFMYQTPSAIAKVAREGSIIEIEAAEYLDDVAIWEQNNITLRAMGGRAHIKTRGKIAQRKAIWVIKGNNVVVENIEFSGAKAPNKNGAGIRMEGTHLTLRHCHFYDNEMGLLTGRNPASEIIIEYSEFNNNTVDYKTHHGLGHNIYIGEIAKFTLKGSYVHDAETGHNVKSRARENYILYNRITDEKRSSSYLLDLPNGGDAIVIGNLFHQGIDHDNYTLLSFSAERNKEQRSSSLYVVNNTFVNSAQDAVFIVNHSLGKTTLINNLFVGAGKILQEAKVDSSNVQVLTADFVNPLNYDYRLQQTMSEVINQGVAPGVTENGFNLNAQFHYRHPAAMEARPNNGKIDIGAYEFLQ